MIIKSVNKGSSSVFPQANDIYKVYDLGCSIYQGITSKESLMIKSRINNIRQFEYYRNAGIYLDLFDSKLGLTDKGSLIFPQDKKIALPLIVFQILSVDVFLEYYKKRELETIKYIIKDRYNFSEKTASRRSQTMKKWIQWCDIVVNDFDISVKVEEDVKYGFR